MITLIQTRRCAVKKVCIFCLVSVLALALACTALAADQKVAANKPAKASQGAVPPKMAPVIPPMAPRGAMNPNFNMMMGVVSNIDMTDPAKVKLEVKNERDNKVHSIEVIPATNVTKVTEISEVKVGDTVRIMARKVDDKEVAMGVMFGKFKKLPPMQSSPMAMKPGAQTPPPATKVTEKK